MGYSFIIPKNISFIPFLTFLIFICYTYLRSEGIEMLNRTATSLANRLILHGVITKDVLDVYVYGFELLLSFLFSTTIIVISGFIMDKIAQTFAFLAVFILLRSFSGGYHSNTYFKCSIITFFVYGMVMLFSTHIRVTLVFYIALLIVGLVVLFIKAPVENPNKELTEQEKKKHRNTSLMLFSFFCLVGMWLNVFTGTIGATIWVTLIVDLVLIFVKTNYKRRIV